MKINYKIISILATALVGASCSTNNQIYYKDGARAQIIECDGPTWSSCLKEAGQICTEAGYTILEKNSGKKNGFLTSSDLRELIISCKPTNSTQVAPNKISKEENLSAADKESPPPQDKSVEIPKDNITTVTPETSNKNEEIKK